MRGWRSRRASGWSPLRFARRSALGHRRGQTAALVAVSALITACTAFTPVYDRAMQQALVDTLLARSTTAEKAVIVVSEAEVNAGGAAEARDPRDLQAMVPRDVAVRLGPPVLGRTASVTPAAGDVPPTGPLVWREGGCEHVRVLSGACPEGPGEILVSVADVENFGLAVGSTPRVRPALDDQAGVRLEVVGTYEPRDEPWWQGQRLVGISSIFRSLEPTAAHDSWLTTEETFVVGPVFLGETAQSGASVLSEGTGVDEVLNLGDRLRALSQDVKREDGNVTIRTSLGDVTDSVRAQTDQAHSTVPLLVAPLAVLSLFVLWLVLGAATEQRRGEVAVARLRGRGPAGAVGLLLVELLPVLLAGVVLGSAAALAAGALARGLLPGAQPFETGPGFATAVLLGGLAVALTTMFAAGRVAREPLDSLMRRGRGPSRRWALGALDAFLVAAVATGVLAFVTGSLRGPFALVGPALLALLAGLLLGHVAAPTAAAVGRRLLRRGHLVTGVTLLEMGRRRETRVLMAVVTVASALAVFATDALVVGERNRVNASQHDAGAPVVLRVEGRDLDGVRTALSAVDPTGHRATPVMLSRDTLAVEPDGFRRIAFFPRGAPSDEEWRAIAAPDKEPVTLTGTRFSLMVRTGDGPLSQDIAGPAAELGLTLEVTAESGTRRTIPLGTIPRPGERRRLVGNAAACATGCRLAAVGFAAYSDVDIPGEIELGDLLVDGRPVAWPASKEDWNATDDEGTVIRATSTGSGALHLELSFGINYDAELTPAWVPGTVSALLPVGRRDPFGVEVTGVDGSDRPARSAGRLLLIPGMPGGAALVDLDAITRGAEFTPDTHVEVWLVDDEELVAAVVASLREAGIAAADVRRYATVRQTYEDTVATWSLDLGAVVGPAVILIALLVLMVVAVTGWRERARDLAILRLDGAGRRTTRRLAVWAQLPGVLLAIATGVAAGVVGGALAMPDISFFPTVPQTPVIDPSTAWPAVLGAAVVGFVVLPAAVALAGLGTARRAHYDRVKESG